MYYKLGQACVRSWGGFVLLQIRANIVTNWGRFYKLGQLLLENMAAITTWSKIYYELGQVLQIRTIITNWRITTRKSYQYIFLMQPLIYITMC